MKVGKTIREAWARKRRRLGTCHHLLGKERVGWNWEREKERGVRCFCDFFVTGFDYYDPPFVRGPLGNSSCHYKLNQIATWSPHMELHPNCALKGRSRTAQNRAVRLAGTFDVGESLCDMIMCKGYMYIKSSTLKVRKAGELAAGNMLDTSLVFHLVRRWWWWWWWRRPRLQFLLDSCTPPLQKHRIAFSLVWTFPRQNVTYSWGMRCWMFL